MMKRNFGKVECLLAVALTLGVPAFAQSSDSSAVIQDDSKLSFTLDEAKKYALAHNRTIKNASYDVQKSEAARWKAIASMLPQVSGNVGYNYFFDKKSTMKSGEMEFPISNPAYFEFGITATATVSGSQIVGVKVSKIAEELSQIGTGKTDQVITANVEKSYVNILALEKTRELLTRNLENLNNLHKMTMNAVKAGAAEQNDADQIAVQVSSMNSALNQTSRGIEVLYNTIRLMTGAKPDAEIVLTQTLDDVVNPETILSLMGEDLSLSRNFDYLLKWKSLELSDKQVTLSKMAYVPNLSLFYNYASKAFPGDEGMNMVPPHTVGFKLNVPIFSSGSRWADVKSAKLDYEKARNEMEDTEQQLGIQARQLRYNLTSAYENFEIQSNNIGVMQRVFKSNTEKFKYGTISSMQLTTSSTELVNAQNTYINALLDMVNAHVELRNLLNR
ncbi:MAG: TolC family protein [Paludibacteraceae bacterium]|nr:TolC family protein [Paludibacteraceae bacterium]